MLKNKLLDRLHRIYHTYPNYLKNLTDAKTIEDFRQDVQNGNVLFGDLIEDLKEEKESNKLKEFINNIIADIESNIKFQPTDVLYADMAGKLSAYRYIKKNFLED